jgi:hypothetical protein
MCYCLCGVCVVAFTVHALSSSLCMCYCLCCMHVVTFIMCMLLPSLHTGVPSIYAVEPITTWIICLVMVADATITIAADVAGDSLAGGIGIDLVAVSGS